MKITTKPLNYYQQYETAKPRVVALAIKYGIHKERTEMEVNYK